MDEHVPDWPLFAIPAIALLARSLILINFARMTDQVPSEEELDREGNRAIILPLAGFSFSALLALVVLDASRVIGLQTPIILLLLSFLGFYSSLNLQSYKAPRWQDQIATGLKEAASGWLLLSVVAIVNSSAATGGFKLLVTGLALAVWVGDLLIRLTIDYRFYRDMERV